MQQFFYTLNDICGLRIDRFQFYNVKLLAILPFMGYNYIANIIKVLVRDNPLGLMQWKPMNLVRSERKQR